MNRRSFIKLAGSITLFASIEWLNAKQADAVDSTEIIVNDKHAKLNRTRVKSLFKPNSKEELCAAIKSAATEKESIAICGGRHAAGGQQFATDSVLIDMSALNKVLSFDKNLGLVTVESGIIWTQFLEYLEKNQEANADKLWGISQKQTGADSLSLGGTLSANAHGQGLSLKPFISDVESFTLINAEGKEISCNRTENEELFRLVIGGYGLFGIIYSVTLRLVPRQKVQRKMLLSNTKNLPRLYEEAVSKEALYGSFNPNIDDASPDFLTGGIFAAYYPVSRNEPVISKRMENEAWLDFVCGAHNNKTETFKRYIEYYKESDGSCNWSDVWQCGPYLEDYHKTIEARLKYDHEASEVLTEIYVPLDLVNPFMEKVREYFVANKVNLIYSTIRFIKKDTESYLAWAKQDYACIIFNIDTIHTDVGIESTKKALCHLIDLAIAARGSYYLTYHRYADKIQVLECYPQMPVFLKMKLKYDPNEIFQSDWYRHYKRMFN